MDFVYVVVLLHAAIKDFLWTHPWWHSFLAAVPAMAVPILAYFEWRHSGEANGLRIEANALRKRIADLTAELDTERNKHLQQIARNTEKSATQAEKNADTLRRHLRAKVTVNEERGVDWSNTPEIAQVSDDNIVTLFTPASHSSPSAWCIRVHCGDLEIADIPHGTCPLRLKVLKRYGPNIPLGEITRWEDHLQAAANPKFPKGDNVHYAVYNKPGSPETRSLHVYASRDGANSFLLEPSTGDRAVGDNVEISKRFMSVQIDYQAAGFGHSRSGIGSSPYRLFVQ